MKRLVPMVCAGILGLTGAGVAQTLVVEELPRQGTDISVGADGTAWLVGYDPPDKTRDLFRWNGSAWDQMEGDGFRIAVDPQGKPWVLDGDGDVKYWDGANWFERPGRGTDIAVGANGDVWMVGWYNDLLDTDRNPENRDIFHWTGSDWEEIDGGAVRIAVAPDGTPWILNDDGRLRQRVDGEWVPVDGRATDIGIGADGAIWVTTLTDDWGEDGKLAMLQGTNWITQTRSSAEVSVDPAGRPAARLPADGVCASSSRFGRADRRAGSPVRPTASARAFP